MAAGSGWRAALDCWLPPYSESASSCWLFVVTPTKPWSVTAWAQYWWRQCGGPVSVLVELGKSTMMVRQFRVVVQNSSGYRLSLWPWGLAWASNTSLDLQKAASSADTGPCPPLVTGVAVLGAIVSVRLPSTSSGETGRRRPLGVALIATAMAVIVAFLMAGKLFGDWRSGWAVLAGGLACEADGWDREIGPRPVTEAFGIALVALVVVAFAFTTFHGYGENLALSAALPLVVALLTVEGPTIYYRRLVRLKANSTIARVKMAPEYTPNCYVTVSFVYDK